MKCQNCGNEVSDNSKFCPNCGNKLESKNKNIICPNCNSEISIGSKFCPHCGCALEESKSSVTIADTETKDVSNSNDKEKSWWDEYKEERVEQFDAKTSFWDRWTEKEIDNKFINKLDDYTNSFLDKNGLIRQDTSSLITKILPKSYQNAFNILSDDEKAVWNLKLVDNDLMYVIRKLSQENQDKYLPIFVNEVKEIANDENYDYVELYKKSSKGRRRTSMTTIANTWSRQKQIEKQIEEYYNV